MEYLKYMYHGAFNLSLVQTFPPSTVTNHISVYYFIPRWGLAITTTTNNHFYLNGLALIPAWISNHMPSKVCDEIT